MKYNMKSLSEINQRFIGTHCFLKQSDVDMANELVAAIENSRSENKPQPGDMVIYTNKYGEYFPHAHIETVSEDNIYFCERANTYIFADKEKVYCNSSGGKWGHIDIDDLKYTGEQQEKPFWHFGSCGVCADGGIDFYAKVNVWECDLNEEPFSTKTHDKYYLSYSAEENEYGSHYFASTGAVKCRAWKTEEDLQVWLRVNRAVINNRVAWTYKTVEHHLSPTEFDSLNAPEDIFLMNGSKRRCKRVYDDKNYTIHLYFVWYWKEEGDFYKIMERQNKAIDKYEVSWNETVNSIALNELRSGKAKPLEIKFD